MSTDAACTRSGGKEFQSDGPREEAILVLFIISVELYISKIMGSFGVGGGSDIVWNDDW